MTGRHLRGLEILNIDLRGMGENFVHQMLAFQPSAFSNTLIPFCFFLLPSRQTKPWKPKKVQITVAPPTEDESKKKKYNMLLAEKSLWEMLAGLVN